MLQSAKGTASFPYPGSLARYADKNWLVLSHRRDGTALLGAQGASASFTRSAPIDDLTDPSTDDLPIEGLDRHLVRTLVWLRDHLAPANSVVFQSLLPAIHAAARAGDAQTVDAFTLCGLLRRLGWSRTERMQQSGQTIWSRAAQPSVVL